jgi:hypothetical protein
VSAPDDRDRIPDDDLERAADVVSLYRRTMTDDFAGECEGFANALSVLHWAQGARGLADAARATSAELVEVCRRMMMMDQRRYRSALATALRLAAADQRNARSALPLARESAALFGAAAEIDPGERVYLMDSLVLLSGLQADLRAPAEAHQTAERALAIGRQLVTEDPDGYRPALITALRRLGSGDLDPAVGIARGTDAVQLARQQARADIDSGLPLLVAALQDVSVRLAAGGREADAVAAFVEASSIQRHLPLPDTPDPARVPHSPRVPPGDQGDRVDTLIAVSDVVCQLRHRQDDPGAAAALPAWLARLGTS